MSHRLCSYCGSEIAFARRLKGELYCSSEHAELDFQQESQRALARLVSMPSLFPPRKKASRPLASQVQEHTRRADLDSSTTSPDPRRAEALAPMPTAFPPQPPKSTPAETEWSKGIRSAFLGLRLPNPQPLDQFEQVDLAIASELEPPQPNAELQRGAQPVTGTAAPEPPPGTLTDLVPTNKKQKRITRVPRFDASRGRRFAGAGRLSVGSTCPKPDARGVCV